MAIKRLWIPAIALAAISVLALPSLRHLWTVQAGARPTAEPASRAPVLVELFTSEGCSSCPPADALLEKFDRSQPIRDADLIVLSEHVDYWDDGGWRDPFSSHALTVRQSDYADRFRLNGPYTPQMVVDGDMEFVGSDERRAIQVIEGAAKTNKLLVALSSIHLADANALALHVEAGPFASSPPRAPAKIWIALADDYDQSSISAGENAGATIRYVAVVRSLAEIGTIASGASFSRDVTVSAGNANHSNLRIIAFVQQPALGRVLGVASARLPNRHSHLPLFRPAPSRRPR